jgi:uncharacterized membrane protein YfcA
MINDPFILSEIIIAGVAGIFVGRLLSARIIGGLLSVFFGFIVLQFVIRLVLNEEPNWSLIHIQGNLARMIASHGIAVLVFLGGLFLGLNRRRGRIL